MASIAERVRARVEDDLVLAGALARGVLNYRATALWLLEEADWDASEDAVVSALRRLEAPSQSLFSDAREVLADSHVNTRSRMCSVRLASPPSAKLRLSSLFDVVDAGPGDVFRVSSSDQGFKLIVDESNLEALQEALAPSVFEEMQTGLTEIDVVIPSDSRQTPGILAVICNKLALHDINIEETVDGVHQHILLVDADDAIEAHRVLSSLTDRR